MHHGFLSSAPRNTAPSTDPRHISSSDAPHCTFAPVLCPGSRKSEAKVTAAPRRTAPDPPPLPRAVPRVARGSRGASSRLHAQPAPGKAKWRRQLPTFKPNTAQFRRKGAPAAAPGSRLHQPKRPAQDWRSYSFKPAVHLSKAARKMAARVGPRLLEPKQRRTPRAPKAAVAPPHTVPEQEAAAVEEAKAAVAPPHMVPEQEAAVLAEDAEAEAEVDPVPAKAAAADLDATLGPECDASFAADVPVMDGEHFGLGAELEEEAVGLEAASDSECFETPHATPFQTPCATPFETPFETPMATPMGSPSTATPDTVVKRVGVSLARRLGERSFNAARHSSSGVAPTI